MSPVVVASIAAVLAYAFLVKKSAAAPALPTASAPTTRPVVTPSIPLPVSPKPPTTSTQVVPPHPNVNLPNEFLKGLPASYVTMLDRAYASRDPLQLLAMAEQAKKLGRADLAGIITDDAKLLARKK